MTNTKPTWEERLRTLDVEFLHGVPVKLPKKTINEIIEIIQKVEQEAYERGYNDGVDFLNYSIAPPKINKL